MIIIYHRQMYSVLHSTYAENRKFDEDVKYDEVIQYAEDIQHDEDVSTT
jgi:hypothetical protein